MNQTQKELYRMLFGQVADTPQKLRPCDAWRLWDAVEDVEAASHHTVKQILKAKNMPAFEAYQEYENEEMEGLGEMNSIKKETQAILTAKYTERLKMKEVSKDDFFKGLELFNMEGGRQVRDVMPSQASIRFDGRECRTDWICQKSRHLYGTTVSDTHGINATRFLISSNKVQQIKTEK